MMAPPGKPKTTSTPSRFNTSQTICAPVRLISPPLELSSNNFPAIFRAFDRSAACRVSMQKQKKPPSWAASACAPALTVGLGSSTPSQPTVAPAKQEHTNDDNKQAQSALAGPRAPQRRVYEYAVVVWMSVHVSGFPVSVPDGVRVTHKTIRAALLGGSGLCRVSGDHHLPNS